MSRVKLLLVCVLLLAVGGCAASRHLAVPGAEAPPAHDRPPLADAVGAYVKVRLLDGETVSGELAACGADSLVLARPRNYAFEQRAIAFRDVKDVKVVEDGDGGRLRFTPISVFLTATFAALILLVTNLNFGAGLD